MLNELLYYAVGNAWYIYLNCVNRFWRTRNGLSLLINLLRSIIQTWFQSFKRFWTTPSTLINFEGLRCVLNQIKWQIQNSASNWAHVMEAVLFTIEHNRKHHMSPNLSSCGLVSFPGLWYVWIHSISYFLDFKNCRRHL